jgi:4-amino-4-deoxy-L-arabinose transferase-like glycosyltransferase
VATLKSLGKAQGQGPLAAEHYVLLLIAVALAGRLAFAGTLGLGIDERYTVATARAFALSTFDHPPLAWWLAGGARWLFGAEAALAVRLPFVLLFALTTWLMFAFTRQLFDARAGLFAAVTLNLAPVLAWTTGSFVLPDGPLIAASMAGAYCLARVLFGSGSPSPLWWLAAGACGGLACLSKLHGLFLFAGTALYLLTTPAKRHWLLTPWPYLGVAIAAVMFTPVIVWNIQHDWVSFAFQGGRARITRFDLLGPLRALGGHALYLLPWLWLPLVISLVRAALQGPRDERGWLAVCLAMGPILVFTLVALSGNRVLYHWAAPGYLFAFALLGRDLAAIPLQSQKRARVWLASTAASLVLILAAVMALARLPWPPLAWANPPPYPLIETVSWAELEPELARRGLLARPNTFVLATRWHEAARIDVALAGRMPVRCPCSDARGYGVIYRHDASAGQDAVIIGERLSKAQVEARYAACFSAIEQLPPVTITQAGAPIAELQLFLGRRFSPQGHGGPCNATTHDANSAANGAGKK